MRKFIFILFLAFTTYHAHAQRHADPALALQYFQNGEYDKAVELYGNLYDKQPDNKQYYQNYTESLMRLGQYDKAEKVIRKQIKKFPLVLSLRIDLGDLYAQRSEKEKANREYESAIVAMKADPAQISDLANTFVERGDNINALKTYLEGRKLLKENYAFTFEITRLYSRMDNKQGIVEELLGIMDEDERMTDRVQNQLQDYLTEEKDYDLLKNALLKRIQRSPERVSYTALLIWGLIQQKNFDMALIQTIAMDKRLNEDGRRIMDFAVYCRTNREYGVAIKAYQHLVDRGTSGAFYQQAKLEKLLTQNQKIVSGNFSKEDALQLEQDYLQFLSEFGRNAQTAFAMRGLANLQAQYLGKAKEGSELLEDVVDRNLGNASFIGQSKLDLGDIYILTGEIWDAALLYGQVDKAFRDDPLGQQAKFRNARLSYYTGEFDWAKAQLDVLKASTSQLIANDALNLSLMIADNTGLDTTTDALEKYAKADLYIFQNKFEEANILLDSITILYPNHSLADEILWARSQMAIKRNQWNVALNFLQEIYTRYNEDIWSDDAMFSAAEIYENRLNQPQKAMELYEKIILDYPGSLFVVEARKRFRSLRGDTLN